MKPENTHEVVQKAYAQVARKQSSCCGPGSSCCDDSKPYTANVPVLGLLGFLVAGLLGVWLAFAILRSGRL